MTKFLILWWMSQMPYAAVLRNRVAAEAAANVRNALMVEIGAHGEIVSVVDWYRRDDAGRPLPAEMRDLTGQPMGSGGRGHE